MAIILPDELNQLKVFRQWVAWGLEWDENRGKPRKPPINPHTGRYAEQDNPETWGTFEQAMSLASDKARAQGLQVGQNHGVGFEFGDTSGIAGIDLDHVIMEDGSLKDFAADIVRTMNSYTEYSPSGRGLHILFRVNNAKRLVSELFGDTGKQGTNNQELGAEFYLGKHYFTITGKVYGDEKPITERTEEARTVYGRYFAKEAEPKPKPTPKSPPPVEVRPEDMTDRDLWEHMFSNPKNGRDIQALYNGDISGYGDDWSRADLALCNHLAFWTGKDAVRMDRMFRDSGLMRDKWERADYRDGAIQKAIDDLSGDGYSPEYGNINSVLPQRGGEVGQTAYVHGVRYISQYLENSLEGDIGRFQRYSDRKTGYYNIDARTSLYPGLYVLGAVSSLGKTTFAHQMADQIARAGDHVLFFVLEQTELELVTKGLSRLTAQEDMTTAISSVEIRAGRITDAVRRAIAEYKRFSFHEAIIECNFNTTIEQITSTVREYIRYTGAKPVVFVDYLQLIRPSTPHQTTKDAVDEHVRAFKQLQMENDLVIILISSLNRQNYLTTIDFEAFKETGGIEYTADVIWGLQLAVMNAEIFDSKEKLKTKRELVRIAKRESPRKIELCILKNRYGVSTGKYDFDYYAKYDLFLPVEERESPCAEILENATGKHKRTRI